uniref:Secreted protein n=1 Tax=Coturnix japonica TaxID=93934 RepID=A0A8C2TUH1_COTJA
CFFCLFLFLSFLHIHTVFHGSNKAAVKKALEFYKFAMVGVKENIVNCTVLLTPKSNFFCLVYLDFSVCFVVKQPTRVVVHKTAFES